MRIYLDSNIYRELKNGTSEYTKELKEKLLDLAEKRIIICYSHAHILDFDKDQTDKKFADLEFMTPFVDNNYIDYDFLEKRIHFWLATPIEAYDAFKYRDGKKFKIFEDEEESDHPFLKEFNEKLKSYMATQEVDLKLNEYPYTDQEKAILEILNIDRSNYTLMEWSEVVSEMFERLFTDNKVIRAIRRNAIEKMKSDNSTVDITNPEFNTNLLNTYLKSTLIDLVKSSFKNFDNTLFKDSEYIFYSMTYCTLNFLGLDTERNSKVKFSSVLHDSYHSYYGSFCDVVVSNDAGFIEKSNTLYHLFKYKCRIVSFKDLLNFLNSNLSNPPSTTDFVDRVSFIFKDSVVDNIFEHKEDDIVMYQISLPDLILDYFDSAEVFIHPTEYLIYLFQRNQLQFKNIMYKEINNIISQLGKLFNGPNTETAFLTEQDIKQLKENQWQGRRFEYNDLIISLDMNEEKGILSISIFSRVTKDEPSQV